MKKPHEQPARDEPRQSGGVTGMDGKQGDGSGPLNGRRGWAATARSTDGIGLQPPTAPPPQRGLDLTRELMRCGSSGGIFFFPHQR